MSEVAKTFTAELRRDDRNLGWTVADVPFDPRAAWPAMQGLRVVARVRGEHGEATLRTSLFVRSAPPSGFYLLVNRAALQSTGLALGAVGEFTLVPDLEPRPATLPAPLDALLDEAEGLRSWYESFSEYARREMGKWICAAVSEDAQGRRAEDMAERLLAAMEAETVLPPLLERAFGERPRARQGWAMTPASHRREELMALFSYKSPEAQGRRLGKLLEKAEARAEKSRRG